MSTKMNKEKGNHSDSDDTLTSSDLSDLSDYEGDREDDDFNDIESFRSLAFSVASSKSTASVKSAKTKKKVRFKPGDSLVLVYVIPNREMLGLHSASESSDSEYSASSSDEDDDDENDDDKKEKDEDSDDEKDEEKDEDEEEEDDDDDDDDDDNDSDDEDEDDENLVNRKRKPEVKNGKPKITPVGRLVSIKQVKIRKPIDFPKALPKLQERVQKGIDPDGTSPKQKRKLRKANKLRERKERAKSKKENTKLSEKAKKEKGRKNKNSAIKVDIDKSKGSRRNKSRLLEIKATVDANHRTKLSVPKVVYKHDLKPSVLDVNGSSLSNNKQLIHRSKLQPTSIRLSKRADSAGTKRAESAGTIQTKSAAPNNVERPRSMARVVSASYDSLTSVLPSSYVSLHKALEKHTIEENIHRLDPNDMNASNKRLYAWQIANGNITSQSLRTPSILPFLDSLKSSVLENGAVNVPS